MWRGCKGFTLVEVLAALVVWMMIASVLLPGLIKINQERKGFILEQQARFLLTLELENIRTEKEMFTPKTINKGGIMYSLSLLEEDEPTKLCVNYTDYKLLVKERCVYVRYP
ncbi:type II secretion system protein [Bacillus sp. LL01]|uniref:type II secretion system protein n=1 Tax=Bacillus sp. LL01 TaxID=1665556 RepID=UPI0012FE81DB|nr:type II secretion system protein [Bacillus sp. LL01]